MADTLGVDVREGSEELVDVEFYFKDGHGGLHLIEVSGSAIHGLWNELLYQIEVNFILLGIVNECAIRVEKRGEGDHLLCRHWSSKRPSVRQCLDV